MENPRDFFIIDTKTRTAPAGRDWEYVDPMENKEFKKIVAKVEDGTIGEDYPRLHHRLYGNAANFHEPKHLTKECFKYGTRADGTVWIPKDKPELASRILFLLQEHDSEIKASPFGLEIPAHEPPATEEENERNSLRSKIRQAS